VTSPAAVFEAAI